MGEHKEVFVFGSGFTHAFEPKAPLLIGDWGLTKLMSEYKKRPFIDPSIEHRILQEFKLEEDMFDIEKMMTRLSTFIPHNNEEEKNKLELLYSKLLKNYIKTINEATYDFWTEGKGIGLDKWIFQDTAVPEKALLGKLALHCKKRRIDCITLNCDLMFDEALFLLNHDLRSYWHPDSGYGFFCKPIVPDQQLSVIESHMEYLKLHGSINWRYYESEKPENNVENIHHFEDWFKFTEKGKVNKDFITSQLSDRPVVVPPLLLKSDFMKQPIFLTIWKKAAIKLKSATNVTIIGYSFPETDFTVKSLFSESIGPHTKIRYITREDTNSLEDKEKRIKNIFNNHSVKDIEIIPCGAQNWAIETVKETFG